MSCTCKLFSPDPHPAVCCPRLHFSSIPVHLEERTLGLLQTPMVLRTLRTETGRRRGKELGVIVSFSSKEQGESETGKPAERANARAGEQNLVRTANLFFFASFTTFFSACGRRTPSLSLSLSH